MIHDDAPSHAYRHQTRDAARDAPARRQARGSRWAGGGWVVGGFVVVVVVVACHPRSGPELASVSVVSYDRNNEEERETRSYIYIYREREREREREKLTSFALMSTIVNCSQSTSTSY